MYGRIGRIHLIGIGGTGMSGIAEVLINRGYTVSGSDIAETDVTARLARLGATIGLGHDAAHVGDATLVVVSSAIGRDNPEMREARRRNIPVVPRAEMLAELMRTRYGIAIAGAHGKTTTTSLVGAALAAGGLDPTVVVGGRIKAYGTGTRLGAGEFIVAEADESDASFLMLSPAIAVVTNVDLEHVEHYGSLESIIAAFQEFANKVPFYGVAILCANDPLVMQLAASMERRVTTYGTTTAADLVVTDVEADGLGSSFRVSGVGEFRVSLPGRHNVLNATAAIAVGLELGIDVSRIQDALGAFEGVGRRFDVMHSARGVIVVDDYGHHPTEVRATLDTAREIWPRKKITCVFQPHRYTRTQALWRQFGAAFTAADRVWLLPIYSAGEPPITGIDAQLIVRAAREAGHTGVALLEEPDVERVAERLAGDFGAGDVVVTLGAGNVWKVHRGLVDALGGEAEQVGGAE